MIESSIYSQIQAPKQTNRLAQFAQMQQIEAAQNQNRLADLMYGEKEREIGADKALAGLLSRGEDVSKGLASQGFGKQSIAYTKTQQDAAKQRSDAEKAQLEHHLKRFEVAGQLANGVNDQASYDRMIQKTAEVFGPEAAAKMPPEYNPVLMEENRARAMDVKTQLEQKWKQMAYDRPDANAVLSAESAAAGRKVTERGQDLTDTRARDFNNTKVEENKIKREAKDETANLTKNSQVASFDTMLGTLDRLGKHPGLSRSVGAVGVFPTMPGSDSANFQAELNTFQSQAFIPMVAQLKGMGALSDAEGKKLTAAVGALDPKMGEQAFRDSVARITADMTAARQRMVGGQTPANPGAPKDGATGKSKSGKPIVMRNGQWEYQ